MIIHGDARQLPFRDGCVQCVVTSPPYFGLRDYGVSGQIGLEPTPDAYVATLVGVFREVRRVLADDGVCWLNLGDSYAANAATAQGKRGFESYRGSDTPTLNRKHQGRAAIRGDGIKAKDMIGIPWRVAFALQADGWYLRSDIIWHKPNPMPESVTDRPTKAHEYLFLLAKSERYHYDAAAIAEPVSAAMLTEMEQGYDGLGLKDYESAGVQNPSSVKARIIANARSRSLGQKMEAAPNDVRGSASARMGRGAGWRKDQNAYTLTRNRRSVWTVPTMPYSGAHFATMPEKLVEPCILAGSRPGDRVFDPFLGSGTVGAVAERLGRRWVGLDLNPTYHALAKERTAQRGLQWA